MGETEVGQKLHRLFERLAFVRVSQVESESHNRAENGRKHRRCYAAPVRFTAAGNADRKPFLRVSCAVFLGSTFFEVGVKNNAVIFNNRITIEKTGDFWVTPRLV